jgi:hypothetical protein
VKAHGMDLAYLQRDSYNHDQKKPNDFCTRERYIQYFNEKVSDFEKFSSEEIDAILNELDPYFTGII